MAEVARKLHWNDGAVHQDAFAEECTDARGGGGDGAEAPFLVNWRAGEDCGCVYVRAVVEVIRERFDLVGSGGRGAID